MKKINEVTGYGDQFSRKQKELNKFIKEKSRPIRKEVTRMLDEVDRSSFLYKDVRVTVRQNNLIDEHV